LPLAYTASRLGIRLSSDGTALCPFHHDTHPSLRIWTGDDGVERVTCHPCAWTGDAFDLIQRLRGENFSDAFETAKRLLAEIPEGYVRPSYVACAPGLGPDDWARDVVKARLRTAEPGFYETLKLTHGLDGGWPLVDIWGIGIDWADSLLTPHWSPDGRLVACKVRGADGRRWSKPGSNYDSLYGSWLPRRYPTVLLTEGETDCLWAFTQNPGVDVRAVPAGAGVRPSDEQVKYLCGWITIWLAFDNDAAGDRATEMWSARIPRARVLDLPPGQDLREAKPDLRRLLA
jgi:hypothetical protein